MGGADEAVEVGKEGPVADVNAAGVIGNPSLLDLVLLLEGVDAVLALDVGAAGLLGVAVDGVDGVGDLLPVVVAEVAAVEFEVTVAPGPYERVGGVFGPAVFAYGYGRRGTGGGRGRGRSSGGGVSDSVVH